jgi:LAO/AO transport system kinase
VTGSPGSGKSTLVDRLALAYRARGHQVGIVAVDPSSPFTGGAILGDRIRMSGAENDPGIYIRSMATRGHLGGLAAATGDVTTVMEAAGLDPVIVETVGVGQDEVDVVRLADISVVVLVPGMGDDIQALKAGIMEIGDIFVINKCDRAGVDKMERALRAVLSLAGKKKEWEPPIVRAVATRGEGVDRLVSAIEECHGVLEELPELAERRRRAARDRLVRLIEERLVPAALEGVYGAVEIDAIIDAVVRRERDPYSVVEEILERASFRRWP